jgi:succinate dehydrogenase/fumarate reductase flavoprotein subunit
LGDEEDDHWEWHMHAIVKNSDYFANQDAVEILTKEAPSAIFTLEISTCFSPATHRMELRAARVIACAHCLSKEH